MNWTRPMLKYYAKQELKRSFGLSVLVCFVGGLMGASNSVIFFFTSHYRNMNNFYDIFRNGMLSTAVLRGPWTIAMFDNPDPYAARNALIFIAFLMVVAWVIFVANPVEVGICKFFTQSPYGNRKFGNVFSVFGSGHYMVVVGAMFQQKLFIVLWSFLFLIPGIVKAYAYSMVPFILSENPRITSDRAIQMSCEMTENEKGEIFALYLSFMGWGLLVALPAILAAFIGVYFISVGMYEMLPFFTVVGLLLSYALIMVLSAYMNATSAQLYFALRQKYMKRQEERSRHQQQSYVIGQNTYNQGGYGQQSSYNPYGQQTYGMPEYPSQGPYQQGGYPQAPGYQPPPYVGQAGYPSNSPQGYNQPPYGPQNGYNPYGQPRQYDQPPISNQGYSATPNPPPHIEPAQPQPQPIAAPPNGGSAYAQYNEPTQAPVGEPSDIPALESDMDMPEVSSAQPEKPDSTLQGSESNNF